ncbi:MAG: ABC transporter permease [Candidatus Zixiibacteriota bacterium]|nr:MAG: ABC transporter permease [candidate division Zixibacteria bacterium]
MLKHYVNTTIRNLMRKKLYTSINVFGLAIGLALCLATVSHISYELSFDGFHEHADDIYRVECDYAYADSQFSSAGVMAPLGASMVAEIPEVEKAAVFRVRQITSIKIGDERLRIINEYEGAGYAHGNKLIFADPSYFEVFTFSLIEGNPVTALHEPFAVLISEGAAEEYFPDQDAVGQVVEINDRYTCKVTGILKTIPQNTQLYTDFIISYATLESIGEDVRSWDSFGGDYAYVVLNSQANPDAVASKIPAIMKKHLAVDDAGKYRFRLKALGDIYFDVYFSGNRGELSPGGEASVIYNILAVAVFILIIAVANFINLSTARSSDRIKEVGMRKVFGAHRKQLIRQYLGESIIITFVSMMISILIFEIFKLQVQDVLPRQMLADVYDNPMFLISTAGLILAVGILAGFYPALYLSRYQPITVLQGKTGIKSSRSLLRKALVVFQFAVAAVFVFMTTIIIRQTNYITSMKLGFDSANILVLDFDGDNATDNCRLMQNEIRNNINVLSSTAVNSPPGRESYHYYGFYANEDRRPEDMIVTRAFFTDFDFIETFGLTIVDGRDFSEEIPTDVGNAVIVNEALAAKLGRANPIGSRLFRGGDRFLEIIGVVKDFHGGPLNFSYRSEIVIIMDPEKSTSLAVKLHADDIAGSVAATRSVWETALPGRQFDYTFLDSEISKAYNESRGQSKMFLAFAVFAIAIACLGILGLVSYTSERRTKEIGIRKVLGASVYNIVKLLSWEFILLIVVANAIALPIGYVIMQEFLKYFPYQVGIGIGTYSFVVGIALFFALLVASFQSVKAGLANPVDALRCE